MASSHGRIGEFNSQLEDWCSYTERMQNYFIANDIRKSGKSVATYIAELKRLCEDCTFGEFLQEMLRDRMVCGINDP